jgi:uncharacterized membrane protein (UPF0127 family)
MRSAVVVLLAAALVACGDGDESSSATTAATTTTGLGTVADPSIGRATTTSSIATTPAPRVATAAPTVPATTPAPGAVVPQGFERVAATVTAADGAVCELCLWLAATGDQRALGLMYATDLGGPDGMVFRYESPTTTAFWMKNTVMPLSIAFFDEGGAYVGAFDMAPCAADPCPSYPTPENFVHAIEIPQGMLDDLSMTPGSTLTVSDLPCES